MKTFTTAIAVLGAFALTPAFGAEPTGAAKDAWLTGKIETVYALNPHLNGFAIDTEVMQGAVHLTGTVESDLDRDLAGELAKGIKGVVSVDNDLVVEASGRPAPPSEDLRDGERPFGVWVDDVTTTAAVKTKLLANGHTQGLAIDVDTYGDVVTLSGEVASTEVKQLAEQLARNTDDVKDVRNELVVRSDH
jgi:osmotically-inducible protein OsmY